MCGCMDINRPDSTFPGFEPIYVLVQRWHLQLDMFECDIIKLTFPFVRYKQPPPPGSQLFTGVNGLTLMPVSLPQET